MSGIPDAVASIIDRYGLPFTLLHVVPGTPTQDWKPVQGSKVFTPWKGRSRFYKPQETGNNVLERDIRIVVDPACTAREGDMIAEGTFDQSTEGNATWRRVMNVYRPEVGPQAGLCVIQARQ
jgi:hypothetical protein